MKKLKELKLTKIEPCDMKQLKGGEEPGPKGGFAVGGLTLQGGGTRPLPTTAAVYCESHNYGG